MQTIEIHFDGGCRPTNPGNKYGSYEVLLDGVSVKTLSEIPLGWGTNNEAEFEILIVALEWSVMSLQDFGYPCSAYRMELFTDSTIVRNRLNGRNRTRKSEPQQRMFERAKAATDFISRFGNMMIHWNSRECNVARFGH
jgi:ribonuclease HI